MKQEPTNNGIRPGFFLLLVCIVSAFVALFVFLPTPRKAAPPTPEAPDSSRHAAKKPTTTAPPAVHDAPRTETLPRQAPPPATEPADGTPAPRNDDPPADADFGIQIRGVNLVRDSSMLDLRYMVVAAHEAAVSFRDAESSYVVDLATGTRIPVCPPKETNWPFARHSRARSLMLTTPGSGDFPPPAGKAVTGRVYSVLIPNPDNLISNGSVVSVVMGSVRTDVSVVSK